MPGFCGVPPVGSLMVLMPPGDEPSGPRSSLTVALWFGFAWACYGVVLSSEPRPHALTGALIMLVARLGLRR